MSINLEGGEPNTRGTVDITYGQVPELPGGGLADLKTKPLSSETVTYGPDGTATIKGIDINDPKGPQTYLIIKPRGSDSPPAIVTGFPQSMKPHSPCSRCDYFSGYGGPRKTPTGGLPPASAPGKKLGGRK